MGDVEFYAKDVRFLEKLLKLKGPPKGRLLKEIQSRLERAKAEHGYAEINRQRYG